MNISVTLHPDQTFVAIDRTGFFTKSPSGHGRTPLDAMVDLLDNIHFAYVRDK